MATVGRSPGVRFVVPVNSHVSTEGVCDSGKF